MPNSERTRNLPPLPEVPQYSTPNQSRRMGRGTVPSDPRRKEQREAIPSGPRADERAVKPYGTSTNRTSSVANDARAGTARSSPAANREFFRNLPPCDGPRTPPPALRTLPAADAHARGNGKPAAGDTPCPARSPDTAAPQVVVTNPVPLPSRLRYSTAPGNEGAKTTSRTPSKDRAAHGNAPGLACAANCNHAQDGPRELLLPKVKPRGGAAYSAPGRL
jgi:hypothetical protein